MVRKNVPLAQQVVNEILAGIENGALPRENGMLPSEADLCRRFEVSRSTIREALSRLEQRGMVTRRHGIGTFVNQQRPLLETGLERLESIFSIARRMGLSTCLGEAEVIERPATAAEAEKMELRPGEPVLAVQRVILTGDRPFAFLVDFLPTSVLNKTDLGQNFDGSVLDILIARGEPLSVSHTEIYAIRAEPAIARKLNNRSGEMLLVLEARLYSRDARVVDYSLSYFVPDFFRFRVVRRIDPCDN